MFFNLRDICVILPGGQCILQLSRQGWWMWTQHGWLPCSSVELAKCKRLAYSIHAYIPMILFMWDSQRNCFQTFQAMPGIGGGRTAFLFFVHLNTISSDSVLLSFELFVLARVLILCTRGLHGPDFVGPARRPHGPARPAGPNWV